MPNQYTLRTKIPTGNWPGTENPIGFCCCGCGGKTSIAPQTSSALGVVKGQPYRYLRNHNTKKWPQTWSVEPSGCWLWQGFIDSDGYGLVSGGGRAHRVTYRRLRDDPPIGLSLDHLCHNADRECLGGPSCLHRRCVNPDHLEPATSRDNTMRGRTPAALNVAKTYCKHGHAFNEANTYIWTTKKGQRERRCRACGRANTARHRGGATDAVQSPPP